MVCGKCVSFLLVFLIGHLMGAVPFSLAEIGVYALVLSVIITAIRAGILRKAGGEITGGRLYGGHPVFF